MGVKITDYCVVSWIRLNITDVIWNDSEGKSLSGYSHADKEIGMQERLPLRLPWLHSGNKRGNLVRHFTTVMFVKDHSAVSSRWWKDISAFCKPAINICRWEQSYMNRLHNRIVLRISFNISFAHNTCVPDQGYEFVWKYRFRHARMKFPY